MSINNKCFIIIVVAVLIWLVLQPVERGWCQTDVWLTLFIPFITIMGVCIIMANNQMMIISRLDIVIVLWFIYVVGRAYFIPSYPCTTFCLRITQMMMFYFALRILFTSSRTYEKHFVISFFIVVFCEVCIGVWQFINSSNFHDINLLTGNFRNSGPYSAILAMGLAMIIYLKKKSEKKLFYIPMIVLTTMLLATLSRAALLAVAICVGAIFGIENKRRFCGFFILGLFASLCLYYIKVDSACGRFIIYMISVLSIIHHPVLGSGIGSFFHQYAEEMSIFSQSHPNFNFQSADVPVYAFNDLLRIVVEQGCIGGAFAVIVVVLVYQSIRVNGKAILVGISALFIFSFFSYPLEQLPYQIIVVCTLAYAGTNGVVAYSDNLRHSQYRFMVPLSCLFIVIPTCIYLNQQTRIRIKAELDYHIIEGFADANTIDNYYKILPFLSDTPCFLFDFGKLLAKHRRYVESNIVLKQGTQVSSDPMFYVLQGNNCGDMGAYAEAEVAYKKAFQILPNRLYPLYQLMCLYEKSGERQKMYQMARRVIDFKVKVKSSLTDEMKRKARMI